MLDKIIRQSPIGIAVIDREGLYRRVNPAYCRMYGYKPHELIGRSFTQVFPEPQREEMLARHLAYLDGDGELKGEFQVIGHDGALLDIISESVRFPGDDGRTCRLVYVVDISERKAVEQALRASRQFLQSVLDGLSAHVCVLDETGHIVAVNRAWREFAAANGGRADQVHEGTDYLAAADAACHTPHGDDAEAMAFATQLRTVLDGTLRHFQLEYSCHSPTERRWFVVHVSRIEGSDPPRIVVTHDNISAIKIAQETLRESEALLLDLAASIPGAVFRLAHLAGLGWRFTYMSPGVQDLFEATPEEVAADTKALWNKILPEDRPAHDLSIQRAIASETPWEHEYRIRTPSGRLKWIHAMSRPKRDADGGVVWTGMLTDVSDRKRMEAGLMASEETYRTLFETVPQGIVYHDADGRITSANPAAQRILGLTLGQMKGLNSIDARWRAVREDGSELPGDQHPAMVALRTGRPVKDVVMGVSLPDRTRAWIQVNATPLFKQGRLSQVYSSFEDITRRVQLSHELRQQASTDYLTGVANRRNLMQRLKSEFERAMRHPTVNCCVLAIDLDEFKLVNDTLGHAAGDAVLIHVAHLMREATRQHDLVGRSGGEEFTLLLPDTDLDEAQALAERLRQRIADTPTRCDGRSVPITVSIGIAMIRQGDTDADAVMARADRALYQAKHQGRNLVRLAQSA